MYDRGRTKLRRGEIRLSATYNSETMKRAVACQSRQLLSVFYGLPMPGNEKALSPA